MRNDKIGEMLKKYRKLNSMSVSDVVYELEMRYDMQVAEKTVYGWESNQAHPTTDTFVILCELYKITNLHEAMGKSSGRGKDFPISSDERAVIQKYREQPELQPIVKRVLNMEEKEK